MEKIRWRDMIVACTVLLQLCTVAVAFNLDTEFPIIYNSQLQDYFGYTVALHKNRDGPMALVGAPRANSTVITEVHQPGVLFKCNISLSSRVKCEEVTLDTVGNKVKENGKDFSYYDRKDDMWLGVSLDIQQDRTQNDIVTCGHLWKNQYYRQHHLPNGACYVINSNLDQNSVRKLVPLINRSKQAIIPPRIYYHAYGQAGTSAAYAEDGKSLILGAPGIYDWIGSIVSYPTDSENPRTMYKNAAIPDPPVGSETDSYIGYSVTSGKFFDYTDIFYAVGAPRDSTRYGRVYIFKSVNQENEALVVKEKKDGIQFSEYFGSTVLGINLNGDAYTDLLVGAPFHSLESGGDEGRVAVYISNGVVLRSYAELFGGSEPNARFGTAIANIGDLNQDGFNDVAIGAPYEDGKGAVYIYHGAELGMNVQYVQKIEAKSISFGLSGFGIHISRGVDIDDNHYPDILIGSYASSNAVLLRTRPIVQLFPKLIFNPEQINTSLANCDFNGKSLLCASVSACLRYEGKHVPPTLDFENDIFVEPPGQIFKPRGFFLHNRKHSFIPLSSISEKTQLTFGANTCITHILYIYPNVKDFITPIQIFYQYRLAIPNGENQNFDKSYPIIDLSTPTKIRSAITFQTGRDSLPDLVPGATLVGTGNSGHVTHGEVSNVSLQISVLNKGEPAYRSQLLIYVPPDIPVINQHLCTSFSQRPNVSLVCELGNPFLNNSEVNFQIKLDVTKIPIDKKKLDILLEAVTFSKEIAPDDNTVSVPLHLQAIAATSVTGVSDQEIILYNEEEHFDIPINIIHTYIVRNHGPSPLQKIDIVIYVPIAFLSSAGRMQFLTLTSIETDNGKLLTIPAKCSDTYLNVKSVMPKADTQGQSFDELEIKNGTSPINNHPSYFADKPTDLTMDFQKRTLDFLTKKNTEISSDTTSKERETVLLDCDKENVECIAIQCSASPFSDSRKVAKIKVSAEVRLANLSNYVSPWYRVELVTVAKITMRDVNVQQLEEYPNTAEVKTVFIQENPLPPPEKNITR